MKIISMTLTLLLIGTFSFAMTLQEARDMSATISTETGALVGVCDTISPIAQKIKLQLSDLRTGLAAMPKDAHIDLAIENIDNAGGAVGVALTDCINFSTFGYSNGKLLLDMYLVHIDNELMIAQYGLGTDQKRK